LLRSNTGRILIESHRGAEGLAPENSWPALQLGLESGADFLEVDVQLSQDGIAFLRHNYILPDGRWCAITPWNEIKNITVQDQPFPLLEQVLVWACERDAYLSLDLKTGFMPEGRLVNEVLRLLERTGAQEHAMLISWDHVELLEIKKSHPTLTTRALLRGRLVDHSDFLEQTRADAVSLSYALARPSDIEQMHHADVAVLICEMWQPDFGMVKDLGVDMVSWSDPIEARKLLSQ
jgi:glycerophosphoryl diester phosphodiesterase